MDEQRTDEWFTARLGKVTASRICDVMATIKSGEAAARKNYRMELLCQRLTGKREDGFVSAPMQRGTDLEPIARSAYEIDKQVMVDECGLIDHPTIAMFGASPDGLVNADGMLEIKSPNTAQHIDFLRTRKPDTKYIWQMTAQMACADRAWVDFVSFDDRLPESLQYATVRIERDQKREDEMLEAIRSFLAELDELENEMRKLSA